MTTKPHFNHCFYCQNPIHRDGVCTGHWEFLYKGMTSKQRMMEKRYHREQRAAEIERKYQEYQAKKKAEVAA